MRFVLQEPAPTRSAIVIPFPLARFQSGLRIRIDIHENSLFKMRTGPVRNLPIL